jgi:16S rRNA (cytosine967-C5)-methyltransferase
MKFDNQLRYASTIIGSYRGEIPLHAWLKNFFREHKQMGSKDRKLVSNLVYGFYRLGHAVKDMAVEERLLLGLFLCNETPGEFLEYFRPEWNEHAARSLEEKIALVSGAGKLDSPGGPGSGIGFRVTDIFPWKEELSIGIDHFSFCLSFLRQPDLFLRIRPGYEKEVLEKLGGSSVRVPEFIPPITIRLPNGFKVEELFTPDKEVVVQDYSSQRIAPFLQLPPSLAFWDACAASGGKSILAFDLNPGITITVSDIRESILHNLRQRFRQAGIKKYHSFVADLTIAGPPAAPGSSSRQDRGSRSPVLPQQDLILTDVPCTGSGTWSRTPEELYFFDPSGISRYNEWQKKIVLHTIPYLSGDAYFVYSTCSVFKKENEEMLDFIQQSSRLRSERVEHIKGYEEKADSMFAARLVS